VDWPGPGDTELP
jgi:hypothetical protein